MAPSDGQPVVISTAQVATAVPLANGLALKPGGFGRSETDFALCARRFWLAREFADLKSRGSQAGVTSAVAMEEIAPEPVDIFRVRLDAAFDPWFAVAFPRHSREVLNLIEPGIARGLKKPDSKIAGPLTPEDYPLLAETVGQSST